MKLRIGSIFLLPFLSLALLVVLSIYPTKTHAAGNWLDSSFGNETDNCRLTNGFNSGCWGQRLGLTILNIFTCGINPLGPSKPGAGDGLCWNDQKVGAMLQKQSLVGIINTQTIAMFTDPPADFAYWVDDTSRVLGFRPKAANAQGVGFSGLSALLPIWKGFRNIAYAILALVMIIIGFMVMLRKQIDPKTVVTVQNAIPRIVVSLLLITFSYAIVGLVIDAMYLLIVIAVGVFKSTNLLPDVSGLANFMGYKTQEQLYGQGGMIANLWNLFGPVSNLGAGALSSTNNLAYQILGLDPQGGTIVSTVVSIIGLFIAGTVAPVVGLPIAIGFAIPPLLGLLISIALLLLAIRLFIFFFTAYIQIVLALIFAPFQLVLDAVPGTDAFSSWFNNLIGNALAFPVGAVIFMISGVFAKIANDSSAVLWSPPYATLFSSSTRSIASLMSIAILFSIPSIGDQVKEALKAKPFVSAGMGSIVGPFTQPFGMLMQAMQFWTTHQTSTALKEVSGILKSKDQH